MPPTDKNFRQFHLGSQNDALYIVSGRAPALDNDYPNHDADRTCVAKVFDEDEAKRLIAAANAHINAPASAERAQEPADCFVAMDIETQKQEIFDLFARYGSGDYMPTDEEKEVLSNGLDEILTPPPYAPSSERATVLEEAALECQRIADIGGGPQGVTRATALWLRDNIRALKDKPASATQEQFAQSLAHHDAILERCAQIIEARAWLGQGNAAGAIRALKSAKAEGAAK